MDFYTSRVATTKRPASHTGNACKELLYGGKSRGGGMSGDDGIKTARYKNILSTVQSFRPSLSDYGSDGELERFRRKKAPSGRHKKRGAGDTSSVASSGTRRSTSSWGTSSTYTCSDAGSWATGSTRSQSVASSRGSMDTLSVDQLSLYSRGSRGSRASTYDDASSWDSRSRCSMRSSSTRYSDGSSAYTAYSSSTRGSGSTWASRQTDGDTATTYTGLSSRTGRPPRSNSVYSGASRSSRGSVTDRSEYSGGRRTASSYRSGRTGTSYGSEVDLDELRSISVGSVASSVGSPTPPPRKSSGSRRHSSSHRRYVETGSKRH
eukprot:GFYU01001402.1.p1 GENE.GFYU01001402.1~~GFYU01001402.1.p1  ORF type:complete len:321 (+),score=48.50 GFYU01001402.1:103-1065(+)